MQNIFIEYIYLILIVLALVMLANKLRIAYPIVLVVGGLVISFSSFFDDIAIDPNLVFFIFLPPLLYEAAWQVSWKEFWKWRRIITSFAFPIVIITSCVIAFVSKSLIPGFTLALGFLLGGIISPPDAVSATTVMRHLKVPKSFMSIIEGESLLNDASSLIVFRFALIAAVTGQFDLQQASLSFLIVIVMGILVGLLIGIIFYAVNRWLPTTSSIEVVLTIVSPYCMYYAAEYFHFSGVLAVVSGGLFLSSRRLSMLNFRSRIEGVNVWANLVFVLNGLIFLLIGLQLPLIVNQLGEISLQSAIGYGLAITGVLILTRLLCAFSAAIFTRFASHFITVADPNPGWQVALIFGWSGMRGVVSLAAALTIPIYLSGNTPFPYRNLILFITFIVILVTLVLQGLTLPWLIKKFRPEDKYIVMSDTKQEMMIQKKIALRSIKYLEEKFGDAWPENPLLKNLYERLQIDLKMFDEQINNDKHPQNKLMRDFQTTYLEMLEAQRKFLTEVNQRTEYDEEVIRKYLTLIDLEELKVREKILEV